MDYLDIIRKIDNNGLFGTKKNEGREDIGRTSFSKFNQPLQLLDN